MRALVAGLLFSAAPMLASPDSPATLKSVLLEQFKTTHNDQDWFVPAGRAIEGMTAEQARWKDGNANHSIAQLVSHLIFWNQTQLAQLQGRKPPVYGGKNDETFDLNVDKGTWESMVKQLDDVLTEWEKAIAAADEKTLASWASTIAHVSTHNAYHTGQILYIRKQQGSWNPEKGVK